jgi:hypothetical protein
MRRKWVYDPTTKEMVEVTYGRASSVDAPAVWGDLKPFVSPITGEHITDRGQLRRHMKANGVTFADDIKGTAERARAERSRREASERKRALVDAYEHTRNQERAKSRYG